MDDYGDGVVHEQHLGQRHHHRVAAQDASGLIRRGTAPSFTGTLEANVTGTLLAYQPEAGTTGFYIVGGTLVILR